MNLVSSSSLSSKLNLSFFHSLFKSCIETRKSEAPLVIFRHLLKSDLRPNELTFSLLLKSSACWRLLESKQRYGSLEVRQIQTHLAKLGFEQFVFVSTALLDLYMKLGRIKQAHGVFNCMPCRDVITWNALICGYSRNGYDSYAMWLFVQMLREGLCPHQSTLLSLIPSCGQSRLVLQGKCIHGFGVKAGHDLDFQVKNVLISMYGKCGDLYSSEFLFEEMADQDVVSWNSMIGVYGQNGFFDEAMHVFKQMMLECVEVNQVTIVSLLSANADPLCIHCFSIKIGIINDLPVLTTLVCAYAKRRRTESAEQLYKSSLQNNLISLTAIILSYAEMGDMEMLVEYFGKMQKLGMKLDSVAMVSILHGIADPTYESVGQAFHGYSLKSGLDIDISVANCLMSMYSKFRDREAVFSLFHEMPEKPLISWNSVISGCVQAGRSTEALDIFGQLKIYGHTPDAITIASLLSGCSQLGNLHLGRKLHNFILRNDVQMEDFVGTALIDMYSNCGSIQDAERVFKTMKEPCLATWNTMISCYSWYGFEHKALSCYSEMRKQGLQPDHITFLGILSACTHGGLIEEARRHFHVMTEEFCTVPTLQHYASIVGLLGRGGLFEEAMLVIRNMEMKPDSTVWGALLTGCCIHQELKLGEYLAKKLYLLDYRNGGVYVLMSNLYASQERWDDVERVREMMRDFGGDGCSGISRVEDLISI